MLVNILSRKFNAEIFAQVRVNGYINWFMTLLPGTDLVILDKSIKDAYKLKFRFVRRPLAIASERRPNALRGTSFKILYAHDLSPKNADILHRYAFA